MPSWKDGEDSSKEEDLVGMDLEQHWVSALLYTYENPDSTIYASFCGRAIDPSIKCRLHLAPGMKYVAFEGIIIGRRFYGYGVQMDVDKDMEKLTISKEKEKVVVENLKEMEKLAKKDREIKCILRSEGEIIRNTGKEMDEMQKERN
ncbi:hypothetical protein ZWY2020_050629 [Hordeum vulgare]|nr:hypothetical protein ZWY2020_050629 [Hordeum vulgare]